jgi:hypothetical protein
MLSDGLRGCRIGGQSKIKRDHDDIHGNDPVYPHTLRIVAMRSAATDGRWLACGRYGPCVLLGAVAGILFNANLASVFLVLGLPLATIYLLLLWPLHLIVARPHGTPVEGV